MIVEEDLVVVEEVEMVEVRDNLGIVFDDGLVLLLKMLFVVILVMFGLGFGLVVNIGVDRGILGDLLDWWDFDWGLG